MYGEETTGHKSAILVAPVNTADNTALEPDASQGCGFACPRAIALTSSQEQGQLRELLAEGEPRMGNRSTRVHGQLR
jgi:hypothetical protein